ncbi:DUF4221 domain-containing protein [Bacteroides sp. 519]|nr:DUF4221 domain-containing protein [Bacteroides sp. 519]
MKNVFFILLFLCLISCEDTKVDLMSLVGSNKYITFPIDHSTKLPELFVFPFSDKGKEFLSFQNQRNEILIYENITGNFVKRVKIDLEGSNGIPGGFLGFHIHNFDSIFISSLITPTLFLVDTTGILKEKIDYSITKNQKQLLGVVLAADNPLTIFKEKIFVPQYINMLYKENMASKSHIGAIINSLDGSINELPMNFPPLIDYTDIGTSAGFGAHYSKCFDGEKFVYRFFHDDKLRIASISHESIEEKPIKSKYMPTAEVLRMNSQNPFEVVKAMYEHPSYGSIIYDKYRKVYYQIVFPKFEMDSNDDPFKLSSSGRALFSIMILDQELNCIGETIFPKYIYNSKLFFVLEDGLYISTSHIKNSNYNDDVLKFERLDLVKR